ncbi:unnamed protein product [Leptidea sinapis]|uniref:Uncharacterized protein n=1 Tax=Leptidea sinapis TaxID=189913 RepID=A0A5E4PZ86_9NEOP|nr:unnamed protein product [Leptidea sinapis]
MSGDVQPRKRKDKKRKKDDLGLEEPRGTSAALGEGDVFIHSYQDHGTGGHWCAKIIFFSLMAVLITLIGLIILENRGLSELEANSVESRYSGVLEGWIDDGIDDHHDEHTLELKHPDGDDDEFHNDNGVDNTGDEEDLDDNDGESEEHDNDVDEDDVEDNDDEDNVEDSDDEDDIEDQTIEQEIDQEFEDEENKFSSYQEEDEDTNNIEEEDDASDDQDDPDDVEDDLPDHEDDENVSAENFDNKYSNSKENDDDNNYRDDINDDSREDEHDEIYDNDIEEVEDQNDDYGEDDEEIERIVREISDEDILSADEPSMSRNEELDESNEDTNNDEDLPNDEDGEPPVEKITIPPAGKPYDEIEEDPLPQKTRDNLADEELYEKQQEELRREQEAHNTKSMWLKLLVGGALLAATQAVVRRATGPRDEPEVEEQVLREETTVVDRRMTLIPPEVTDILPITRTVPIGGEPKEIVKETVSNVHSTPLSKQATEKKVETIITRKEEEENEDVEEDEELYSDEEEDVEEEQIKEVPKKVEPQSMKSVTEKKTEVEEVVDDDPEDVEIIEEEEEEEVEDEEEEDEEEISDVDDEELLRRLEAKYGRLPEPERPYKNKDGGNNIEDEWPGEPDDTYWRQQLDLAEDELRQGWLE